METVDVRGLSCPLPVMRTKQVIDKGARDLLVRVDSSVSLENVSRLATSQGYEINMKINDKNNWEMELKK